MKVIRKPTLTRTVAAAAALSLAVLAVPAGSQTRPQTRPAERAARPKSVPGEIVLRHADASSPDERERVRRLVGAVAHERLNGRAADSGALGPIEHGAIELIQLPPGTDEARALAVLRADASVVYAEPNFVYEPQAVYPNDPSFSIQWGLHNTGQYTGKPDVDIDAPQAASRETGSSTVYVGVVDQGIDFNHPDLAGVVLNPGEDVNHDGQITSADVNGQDDDGNGYVDDLRGWDFAANNNSIYDPTSSYDALTDYHGTHVAGVIGAVGNNGKGVAGVNWTVRIVSGKFMGASGTLANAVKAIDYMIDLKTQRGVPLVALNNSWGGSSYSQALLDAIGRARTAGLLFVAAAGNGGIDAIGDNNDQVPFYPASYNLGNVVSVAAIDRWDQLARFSNYGKTSVDVAAPGDAVYSTGPRSGYIWINGTSAAAPHVTGIAALLKADNPGLSYTGIRDRVRNTVVKRTALSGKMVSGGRVNAYRALYNTTSVNP